MRFFTLIVLFALLAASCGQNTNGEDGDSSSIDLPGDSLVAREFPPMAVGEVVHGRDAFGEVIELQGVSIPVDEYFRVSESQMLVRDSFLIVNNAYNDHRFMVYTLPDLRFSHSFGSSGRGPREFQFPLIFRSYDHDVLCYVYERANNSLYALNRSFELQAFDDPIQGASASMFSNKQMEHMNDSTFVFVDSAPAGKEIFLVNTNNPDAPVDPVFNLSFDSNIRSWAAYIGDFGVNPEKNRMVYAYKSFKRLEFINTETLESKTVIFDDSRHKAPDLSDILGPHNITHYWGISAQKNHVYLLYSGRTPLDVYNENQSSSGYIFVEQFDWNGNPIRKFKLDRWGYFTVSEDESTIYLLSNIDEHPFYRFELPGLLY